MKYLGGKKWPLWQTIQIYKNITRIWLKSRQRRMLVCKNENILLDREVRTNLMTKQLPPSFISVTSWISLGRVQCCCQDPNLNKQPNGISSRVSLLISCLQYIEYTTKTKIDDLLNLISIYKYTFFLILMWRSFFAHRLYLNQKCGAGLPSNFFIPIEKKIKLNL